MLMKFNVGLIWFNPFLRTHPDPSGCIFVSLCGGVFEARFHRWVVPYPLDSWQVRTVNLELGMANDEMAKRGQGYVIFTHVGGGSKYF